MRRRNSARLCAVAILRRPVPLYPPQVARNDILEFFQGLSVPLNGVHLMFNEREQPTGVAYVEFASSDERERAMTRDRQHMGGRYVELFRVSRAEMLQALE